jgi:hypothetical protein
VSGDFDSLFKVTNDSNHPTTSKDRSFIVVFLAAIVMAFFSIKNLLTGEKE